MSLFDQIERTDSRPAEYGQPRFDYLNRSARSRVEAIRSVLQAWYEEYPKAGRTDLRGRLRSPDNRHHAGAFLELYLHTLFRRLGYDVALHEAVEGTEARPDFKIDRQGHSAYVEATLAAPSDREVATANRENRVYDALDRMDSPNFFIGATVVGTPESDPPARKMRSFLKQELDKLNPDAVAELFERGGRKALPEWSFEHAGWSIKFRPIPKSPEARGKPGVRPLGYRMFGPEWVNCREGIVAALSDKAGKYGNLSGPYIIAVNVIDDFVDETDIVEALFGQEVVVVTNLLDGSFRTDSKREPNGLWVGQAGPLNTRVSGVLSFENFSYWTMARQGPQLWLNPWAARPLDEILWPLGKVVGNLETGKMERSEGSHSPAEILGLSEDWPIG